MVMKYYAPANGHFGLDKDHGIRQAVCDFLFTFSSNHASSSRGFWSYWNIDDISFLASAECCYLAASWQARLKIGRYGNADWKFDFQHGVTY